MIWLLGAKLVFLWKIKETAAADSVKLFGKIFREELKPGNLENFASRNSNLPAISWNFAESWESFGSVAKKVDAKSWLVWIREQIYLFQQRHRQDRVEKICLFQSGEIENWDG